ncbi:MAG: acetoin utilization protein AcuC [Nocardioides sp.]
MCCEGPASLVFEPGLTAYDFGPAHPLAPVRVDLTIALAGAVGVLDRLDVVPAPSASVKRIATVHDEALIDAVIEAGGDGRRVDAARGLGTADNPTFAGMHEASAHVVGATVEACRRVWHGYSLHSANIAGGLHHATRRAASGFCIYNDVAAGIRWLLDEGAERVAYVDVDVHHGDGVQEIFYDDPRVLTISLHESGRTLFPGTGFPADTGGPRARGSAVNVALPVATSDVGWHRAFGAVVPPLLRAFGPDILVTQHGCDSHRSDPLAHLELTVDGQRAAYLALHELAHEVCGGKWVVTGGGGYALVEVVPRAWTHLLAIVGGRPLEPDTPLPADWRTDVRGRFGVAAPMTFSDGPATVRRPGQGELGRFDGADALDRAVIATRQAVFGLHGLEHLDE